MPRLAGPARVVKKPAAWTVLFWIYPRQTILFSFPQGKIILITVCFSNWFASNHATRIIKYDVYRHPYRFKWTQFYQLYVGVLRYNNNNKTQPRYILRTISVNLWGNLYNKGLTNVL